MKSTLLFEISIIWFWFFHYLQFFFSLKHVLILLSQTTFFHETVQFNKVLYKLSTKTVMMYVGILNFIEIFPMNERWIIRDVIARHQIPCCRSKLKFSKIPNELLSSFAINRFYEFLCVRFVVRLCGGVPLITACDA